MKKLVFTLFCIAILVSLSIPFALPTAAFHGIIAEPSAQSTNDISTLEINITEPIDGYLVQVGDDLTVKARVANNSDVERDNVLVNLTLPSNLILSPTS